MNKMVVCTSTACIESLKKPENLAILPINIHIDDAEYIDGKSITVDKLATLMIDSPNKKIRTTAPHEGQLIEFFYDLIDKGVNEILIITLSSHLSQTHQNIKNIQSIFGEKLKIHLFDSRSIQHGEAILTLEACNMLQAGREFADIHQKLYKIRDKIHLYITVNNLDTMIKNKWVSAPTGWFANIFDIKPIVVIQDDGKMVGYEKIRGIEKSLKRLAEILNTIIGQKKGKIYITAYSQNPYISILKENLIQLGHHHAELFPIASASIANIGVYAIGLMFVEMYE